MAPRLAQQSRVLVQRRLMAQQAVAVKKTSMAKKALGVAVVGAGLGIVTLQTCEPAEMLFYEKVAMPAIRLLDPETAHVLAIKSAAWGLAPRDKKPDDPVLHTVVWGRSLSNPLGIAAGYDKHAEAPDATFDFGAGFIEIGTVTPEPQEGNPKPRMFRLTEDYAVINRYGFNSEGLDAVKNRLDARLANGRDETGLERSRLLGVNVGKNKTTTSLSDDFVKGIETLGPYADFIVVNVSSPNTPGLRALQGKEQLQQLVRDAQAARDKLVMKGGRPLPPLLVKIAPDLTEEDKRDIADVALAAKLDGLVVSNTTISRPDSLKSAHKNEVGGLSGKPLFGMATECLRDMYRLTGGKMLLIGAGGVCTGEDAYAKIKAGASLVEVYSSLAYGGPHLAMRIKRELAQLLKRDGYKSVSEAVGADFKTKA